INKPPKGFDIEFGSLLRSYHLGDNNKSDTSCKLKVGTNTLDGKAVNFNFYVQNDNTLVDVVVYHCGVDSQFANMHRVSIHNPTGASIFEAKLAESTNLLF